MKNVSELLYGQTSKGKIAPDTYRALPVKLHQAREAFASYFRPIFLKYDLTDPQWRVLRILGAVDQIDTADLAKRSLLLGPSLSRILRDLQARKLIVRHTSTEDARRSFHAITASGRELIEKITPLFAPFYEKLASQISKAEAESLNFLLDRICETFSSNDDASK